MISENPNLIALEYSTARLCSINAGHAQSHYELMLHKFSYFWEARPSLYVKVGGCWALGDYVIRVGEVLVKNAVVSQDSYPKSLLVSISRSMFPQPHSGDVIPAQMSSADPQPSSSAPSPAPPSPPPTQQSSPAGEKSPVDGDAETKQASEDKKSATLALQYKRMEGEIRSIYAISNHLEIPVGRNVIAIDLASSRLNEVRAFCQVLRARP